MPNGEACRAVIERNRSDALENMIVLHQVRIAREIEATNKHQNKDEGARRRATSALIRGERGQKRRECEAKYKSDYRSARLSIEKKHGFERGERNERPLEPRVFFSEREPERDEHVEEEIDREICRVAERGVNARGTLMDSERAAELE
jgi:hypothetical protein